MSALSEIESQMMPETAVDVEVWLHEQLPELDLEQYMDFDETDERLIIKIISRLVKADWGKIHGLVLQHGGEYDSKEQRWTLPKPTIDEVPHDEVKPASKLVLGYEKMQQRIEQKLEETSSIPMPDFGEGKLTLEELKSSESYVGQIFPVLKDQHGNILDGFHRKRINPDWKEEEVVVVDPMQSLVIRVHANSLRRDVPWSEKHKWIMEARKLLNPQDPMQPSQGEVAKALGMSQQWVSKHDKIIHKNVDLPQHSNDNPAWKEGFLGYNVWGFKNDDWRKYVVPADPNQPDKQFYHGSTPAFVIHQLIKMFQPKSVLDSMAGVGTTGYVCEQYGIQYDQFDVYPYPKHAVEEGDAEFIQPNKTYDLIFNHIPYLQMVKYGDHKEDLSTFDSTDYFAKLKRIFKKNYTLLNENGIYVILVGDWRHEKQVLPLTAKVTTIGLENGFILYDEAVKLTAEQKSTSLQEYRAAKFGYLAQTFDMVLIFKKVPD